MASRYRYDSFALRFRGSDGRFVKETVVRSDLDTLIDGAVSRITALTGQLQTGPLPLAVWEQSLMSELKSLHVSAVTLAKGGWAQASQADFGYAGSLLKAQYQFLRDFSVEIASGAQPMDGRLTNRATMYADAARATYEGARAREQLRAGFSQERNVLHSQESCKGCLEQQRRGWVAMGALVPVGARKPCLVRCRCTVQRRRRVVEVAR